MKELNTILTSVKHNPLLIVTAALFGWVLISLIRWAMKETTDLDEHEKITYHD